MGILLALASALFFGAQFLAARAALARVPNAAVGAFVTDAVALAVCVVIAAAAGDLRDLDAGALWPYLVAGVVAPGLSQVLLVHAVRLAGPSRPGVVIAATPLVSALAAIAFLDEPATALLLAGTAVVVAGAVSLGWERRRPPEFRTLGLAAAAGCVVLFAARDNLVRSATDGQAPVAPALGAAVVLAAATATTLLYAAATQQRRLAALARPAAVAFAPAGVLIGLAYETLTEAFDRAPVGVVAPLNATQGLWAIAFAAVVLHRHEAVNRRLVVAAALIVAGAALVGAGHG